jgi:glycosyltransferase involved in cell wall biosynthesis
MRISMIGTRGVPAHYGGFETCVEEVGSRLVSRGHEVVVFCRPILDADPTWRKLQQYRGMQLVNLPVVRRRTVETLLHTALSVAHPVLAEMDAAIVFNAANSPLLPVLRARGIPVATHMDGLEWRRAKWGKVGRRYYRLAESLAVRWSDGIIADAEGIAKYYRDEFGVAATQIAYGAPISFFDDSRRIEELDLSSAKYHLVVARFEQENHVLDVIRGYRQSDAELPLVVVGSAPYADAYTASIRGIVDERVRLLGGIWDQEQLHQLYSHALTYVHGHSVGGTNPSLLRAAGAGTYTIAYDVVFNREVLGDNGVYFTTTDDVARELVAAEADPAKTLDTGARLRDAVRRYNWDDVTDRYEDLCKRLTARERSQQRGTGRRRGGGNWSR